MLSRRWLPRLVKLSHGNIRTDLVVILNSPGSATYAKIESLNSSKVALPSASKSFSERRTKRLPSQSQLTLLCQVRLSANSFAMSRPTSWPTAAGKPSQTRMTSYIRLTSASIHDFCRNLTAAGPQKIERYRSYRYCGLERQEKHHVHSGVLHLLRGVAEA